MAKQNKKAAQPAPGGRKRRKRRTADEIIADLEAEIQRVRERQKHRHLDRPIANLTEIARYPALT